MSTPLLTLETAAYAPRERIARWSDALTAVCGRLHTDAHGASTLDGQMRFGTVGRIRLGGITASRHRVGLTPALARREQHPVIKVVVQTRGTSVYEQGGERVVVGPGDGLAYDVSRPHMITSDELTEHLVVIIPHQLADGHGVRFDHLSQQRFSARQGVGRVAAELIQSTFAELTTISPDCEPELAASLINLAFLPLAHQVERGGDSLRYRIQSYVRDHLREPELSLDQIAAALRCSKRYLHMAFSSCDQTLADYIWAMRLDGCREEIEHHPERTISEIAFAWGFSSSAHFSRLFRRRFAMAPSALRRVRPAG